MSFVFVASSVEGKPYAEVVARLIAGHGGRPLLWWSQTAFPVGVTLVESLFEISSRVDSAIIVMTPDDETLRRGVKSYSPGQNVLLEYGLFAGRLGRSRVAVVTIGDPRMPSDLEGVHHVRLPPLPPDSDVESYSAIEAAPRIIPWLQALDAGSSDGMRIASLVSRLAPGAKPAHRIRIKSRILCEQVDPDDFPRLTAEHLEHLLLKYTYRPDDHQEVGYSKRTNVSAYLDLSGLPAGSPDERDLAGHLARYVAELISDGGLRPTVIAISKLASQGLLRTAAQRLSIPLIMVSPYGPNADAPIEGFFEPGDRAILLHDVALSGQHLVDCIVTLRSHGLTANDLVTLTRHRAADGSLPALMRENRINVHCASLLLPEKGRVLSGMPSVDNDSPAVIPCVLCDVIQNKDGVPVRAMFDRDELPTEILRETQNFALIADVAPLMPGHALLVSKRHAISMSKCSPQELAELDVFRREAAEILAAAYSRDVVAFEHGLCNRSKMANCGIDHAHMHLVPLGFSLLPMLTQDFAPRQLRSLESLPEAAARRDEYLLLIEDADVVQLVFTETPTRQYFRRVVSAITGRDVWNWNDEVLLRENREAREWILGVHQVFNGSTGQS